MDFHSPYFLQTQDWAEFWLKANNEKHEIHQIRCQIEIHNQPVELVAFIYQYPWHLGQSFLYIPKGPFLQAPAGVYPSKEQLTDLLGVFFGQITGLARSLKSAFIKIDFDDNLTAGLNIRDNEQLISYLEEKFSYQFNPDTKKLQFLQTPVLSTKHLQPTSQTPGAKKISLESLKHFWDNNQDFWSQVNQTTRRYTKKSLEEGWTLSAKKTATNFKAFWQLVKETSGRQGFNTHPQKYYQDLFGKDFSWIIILRDAQNQPQAAWLGVILNKTMVYLYGGNTEVSRKRHGQYLVHLAALYLAAQEGANFYDLGGYDSGKGYGQFKEGYKGVLRSFLGPVDLVCRPVIYNTLLSMVHLAKGSKSGAKHLASKQVKLLDLVFKFFIGLIITSSLPLWWFTLLAYWPNSELNQDIFEVALVFGASVDFIELKPSLVLQERLDVAAELYSAGKISTVLVSGDNREPDYNEPFVMKKYLVEEKGIPPVSIVEDFGGRRTLDSCWRAKNVFQAERVYLVTQRFHLPRAQFSCQRVGLQTLLAPADDSNLQTAYLGLLREVPASWLAIEDTLSNYEPPVVSDGTEINVEET